MDKKCYRSILNYTPGKQAIERARNNVASSTNQNQLNPVMLVYVMIVLRYTSKVKLTMMHPAKKQKYRAIHLTTLLR